VRHRGRTRVFDSSAACFSLVTEEEVCLSRILVVDDDSASRLVLKSRLAEQGYEIVIAESGARGLMEAREGAFDAFLISADLSSGLPGCEVCRRMKGVPTTAVIPVLLFSQSVPSCDVIERAYEAGCASFVAGNELPGLDHMLRIALKQRRQWLELAEEAHALHEQVRRLQDDRHRRGGDGAPSRPRSVGSARHAHHRHASWQPRARERTRSVRTRRAHRGT
jgi:CheY-like chemotaxis protein